MVANPNKSTRTPEGWHYNWAARERLANEMISKLADEIPNVPVIRRRWSDIMVANANKSTRTPEGWHYNWAARADARASGSQNWYR